MIKNILIVLLVSCVGFANTFFDKSTQLMWQDNREAKSVKKDWDGAKKYCQNLTLDGYSDYRLPTRMELFTIVDRSKYNPSVKSGIKNVVSDGYWSSTSCASDDSRAWDVDFGDGNDSWGNESSNGYVRCVRDSNSDTLSFQESKAFEKIVDRFIKDELKSIATPPSKLKLVKDMFETTEQFEARIKKAKETQAKKIAEYEAKIAQAKQTASKVAIKKALQYTWGKPIVKNLKYDADNGYFVADVTFEAKKEFKKKIAIKVPLNVAKEFYSSFDNLKPQAVFDYDGKSVSLKDIQVPFKSTNYIAQFTDINIDDTKVAVNISNDIQTPKIDKTNITIQNNQISTLDTSKLKDFNTIDKLLAKTTQAKVDKTKWLFVVGIEQYEFTDNIAYATRSAQDFKKVMKKKLGVPEYNCFTMIDSDASQAKIKTNLKKLLRRVKAGDTIYFYYNGHGVPVPNQNFEPFMLTADTEPDFVADEKFFSLKNIYGQLSSSKADKVVAFVDSCFSGVTDGKAVLKGVAATKMKPKLVNFDKEKMVVLSAGKSHQYSNGYDKKGYRLFSYYVMKNILDGDSDIKTLYKDVKKETYDTSLSEYGDVRVQEPTVEGNFRLKL